MSSILDSQAIRRAALPISVEQYHQLGAGGIIPEQTELLQGVILEKSCEGDNLRAFRSRGILDRNS